MRDSTENASINARPEQGAIVLLLGLLLLVASGCCTHQVWLMGLSREEPRELLSLCDNGQERTLRVAYKAIVCKPTQIPEGCESVIRTMTIPYDHATMFRLCSVENLDPDVVALAARLTKIEDWPYDTEVDFRLEEAIQPPEPWQTLPFEIETCDDDWDCIPIDDMEYRVNGNGRSRTNEAEFARIVKQGRVAKFSDWHFLVPWKGEVLLLRLHRRFGKRPWARAASVPLYPLAIATDIVLMPAYVALCIVMMPFGLTV
jgi:hypothetical protein